MGVVRDYEAICARIIRGTRRIQAAGRLFFSRLVTRCCGVVPPWCVGNPFWTCGGTLASSCVLIRLSCLDSQSRPPEFRCFLARRPHADLDLTVWHSSVP